MVSSQIIFNWIRRTRRLAWPLNIDADKVAHDQLDQKKGCVWCLLVESKPFQPMPFGEWPRFKVGYERSILVQMIGYSQSKCKYGCVSMHETKTDRVR
jgi:hypothetical protein